MENSKHKIKVWGTKKCPYCHQLKDFLREKNIDFEDFDVGEDEEGRNEMMEKSGQMGVPVIEIDGEIIIGFDKEKISEKLGLK